MSIKEITEVCRLCVKDENLVWVFDKRFDTTENMRNVIFITTGVEVNIFLYYLTVLNVMIDNSPLISVF